jgi:hypothetical protein
VSIIRDIPEPMLAKNISPAARRSELFTSAIYFLAFIALLLCAYLRLGLLSRYWAGGPYVLVGAGSLLLASMLLLIRKRFADALALIGAIIAWPLFWRMEFSVHQFSAWLVFNYPGLHYGVNGERQSAISVLDVGVSVLAAVSLLIFSVVCSTFRLAPRAWKVRGVALRDRILPAVFVSLCLIAAWFLESVTPYRIPVYDRNSVRPAISILHAEKRGFYIQETRLAIYRDGRAFVTHDQRHLFEYAFPITTAEIYLSPKDDSLLQSIMHIPPEVSGRIVSAYTAPRAWDADAWFVSLRTNPKLVEVSESDLPPSIVSLYQSVPATPQHDGYAGTARDICFGFCYDPGK